MNAFRRRRKEKKEEEKKSNTHTLNADYVVCVMPTYFSNFRPVINPSRTSNCNNPHTKGRPCSKSIGSSDHREEVFCGIYKYSRLRIEVMRTSSGVHMVGPSESMLPNGFCEISEMAVQWPE